MSQPRLTIGAFGDITTRTATSGQVEARPRTLPRLGRPEQARRSYCGHRENRRARSQGQARRLLPVSADRQSSDAGQSIPWFGGDWLEEIDIEGRISKTTRNFYQRNMRTLVLPAFENLTQREIGVARYDHFIRQFTKQSYNRAKQSCVVMRICLEFAVRHKVLPRNSMDHIARLPNALT